VTGPASPELTDHQRRPLQMAFDLYLQHGSWPRYAYIDESLYDEGVEAREILESLPPGLYVPDRRGLGGFRIDYEDELSLTIRGAASCTGSERVVERFLRALAWGVQVRRRARSSSPDDVVDPKWTFGEFVGGVRLPHERYGGVSLHEVTLVLRLME
jgi:hypothetical protein